MGFKTFTCVICGKEGLTKRNSYFIEGKGRACREHEEAQKEMTARKEKQEEIAELHKHNWKAWHKRNENRQLASKYVMKKLDPRPEANLLLNLREFTELECAGEISTESIKAIFESEQAKNNFHPCIDQLLEKLTDNRIGKTYLDVLVVINDQIQIINDFRYFDSDALHELKVKVLTEMVEIFKIQANVRNKNEWEKEAEAVKKHSITLGILLGEYDNSQNKVGSASMIPDIKLQQQMDELSELVKVALGWLWNKFPDYTRRMSFHEAAEKILSMAADEGIVSRPAQN